MTNKYLFYIFIYLYNKNLNSMILIGKCMLNSKFYLILIVEFC